MFPSLRCTRLDPECSLRVIYMTNEGIIQGNRRLVKLFFNKTREIIKFARPRLCRGRAVLVMSWEARSCQQQLVICRIAAAGLGKERQQIGYGELLLFPAGNIQHHAAGIHHNEAVAVGNGVLHVMGNHQN